MAIFVFTQAHSSAQELNPVDSLKEDSLRMLKGEVKKPVDNLNNQFDIGDLIRDLIHPKNTSDPLRKRSGITIIPNIDANPSIGFQFGIKAVAGIK